MDDHTRSLLQHRRQKSTIETNCGEQIRIKRALPIVIGQSQGAAAGSCGTAHVMDQDIKTLEAICDGLNNVMYSVWITDICLYKTISSGV